MSASAAFIWTVVVLLSLYASRWKRKPADERTAGKLILWGGALFPAVVLTALLAYSLWLMPSLRPMNSGPDADVKIHVVGNQFWWNVAYQRPNGEPIASANEIRLPVGKRVEFSLASADMIHSFWIPALGGKMDLIPGRVNRVSLLAERPGTYRGQCAEFCGTSHANMAFPVLAMAPAEFEAWLAGRSGPSPGLSATDPGRALFQREGCGGCHRVDGTSATGTSGPDLSHFGSRLTVGAGLFDNNAENVARFIANSAAVKPGSHMPAYTHLSLDELAAITDWLGGLQ
jgi:cytochrome c oxidase subunit II